MNIILFFPKHLIVHEEIGVDIYDIYIIILNVINPPFSPLSD